MADGGYDVADYRDIDPLFGTLAEAEQLIARGPRRSGIRTIIDIVPNHVSDRAPVVPARRWPAGPGSPERDRFWFRAGRGADGERPPNDWRVPSSAARRGPAPRTRRHARRVVPAPVRARAARPQLGPPRRARASTRTSCASGSTAASAACASTRRRCSSRTRRCPTSTRRAAEPHPFADRDELHEIYRAWRRIADYYEQPRALIGEVWLPDRERFARYLRPDELHTAFNFEFLACAVGRRRAAASIDDDPRPRTRRSARPATVGALQPRRHPPRSPATAARTPSFSFDRQAHRHAHRPRARHPPGPRRGAAHAGAARLGLRLPGRGARPARGRGPPRRPRPGPDVHSVRAASTPAATAAACRCPGRATRRRSGSAAVAPASPGCRSPLAGRRSPPSARRPTRVDAGALPHDDCRAPRASRRRRTVDVDAERAVLMFAAATSSASSTSATPAWASSTARSSSPARR